jgi:DNA-binding NarL/FixJ family response regulator
VTLAIANDYEVVVVGLAEMLAPYADRVRVVELDVDRDVRRPVDVALYDTFSATQVDASDIDLLLGDDNVGAVAAYTWNMQPQLIARAREKGVRGYLSKSLTAERLVGCLERIAAGEVVVEPTTDIGLDDVEVHGGDWPGRLHGLSARQAEIVALLTQGYSNEEIAARAYLSVNTVKSYLRLAYQVMGVSSRSQALLWGHDHGMLPAPGSPARQDDAPPGTPS